MSHQQHISHWQNNDAGLLTRTSTQSYVWQSTVTEMSVKRLIRLLLCHSDPSTGPFTEFVTAGINLKTKIGDGIMLCQSMSYFLILSADCVSTPHESSGQVCWT